MKQEGAAKRRTECCTFGWRRQHKATRQTEQRDSECRAEQENLRLRVKRDKVCKILDTNRTDDTQLCAADLSGSGIALQKEEKRKGAQSGGEDSFSLPALAS